MFRPTFVSFFQKTAVEFQRLVLGCAFYSSKLDLSHTVHDHTKTLQRLRLLSFLTRALMCSQAGGGNWGQSNEVIVKARNSVVVAETERALSEGCRKIMIMYGGLHMQVGDDYMISQLL